MFSKLRPALGAGMMAISAALLAGFGSAMGADLLPDQGEPTLLPQSVVETAAEEALSVVPYTIIDETPDSADRKAPSRSLAALVSDRLDTTPANREEECLAGAVFFEAKSESYDGQLAVARVILNRASSGRFPASVCGVVFQPGQFSFVRGNTMPRIDRNSRDWREALAIARVAQDGLWSTAADRALFFHASHVSPGWRLNRVAAIGNHVFYR